MLPVDKTNRTIKAILARAAGDGFRGRDVYVEEVDPSWSYEGVRWDPNEYPPDRVSLVTPDGTRGVSGMSNLTGYNIRPSKHLAVVVFGVPEPLTARPSHRTASIFIPQLDHVQMNVARDVLLVGDKELLDTLLKPFGAYAGIARAILERQVRAFAKAMYPKKSTRQIRREVDNFLQAQGRP